MKVRACLLLTALLLLPLTTATADTPEVATDSPIAMACFAPGTPPEVVARTTALAGSQTPNSLTVQPPEQFQLGSRWSFTATDGGGLGQGDPMTLTWSIAPDGTFIPQAFAGIDPPANSGLIAFLNGIYGSMANWLPLFQEVFDRWGELTGVTYVYEPNDDGAAFFNAAGQIGVRGDVRIGGKPIDGNSNILAYNFFPNGGDMVIDSPDSFYNNTSSNSLGLRNVLAHEHGHGLGIRHVCPVNQTKLMEPFISFAFDGPQHDDILGANRHYGDDFEHNDASGTAAGLGALSSSLTIDQASVDDNSDIDFFSFDVTSGTTVDVSVTPIGFTYLQGPQNSNGSCTPGTTFNSEIIHDLSLSVLDSDGSTVLASADLNPAGTGEMLTNVLLPGTGTFFVEVDGDATNNAQLYDLEVISTGVCPWPLGHAHYCRDCGPCDAGEGDCDGNAQCNPGLMCVNDVGANYGFDPIIDVCETPPSCPWPLGHAHYCRDCGPCDAGEGDCDGNAECNAGLMCVNDVGANYGFDPIIDVCETPPSCPWPLGHAHYCRDCGPCDAGEGDCDGNAECNPGLMCVNDVGANYGFDPIIDVCETPPSCPWPLGHAHYCRDCGPCDAGRGGLRWQCRVQSRPHVRQRRRRQLRVRSNHRRLRGALTQRFHITHIPGPGEAADAEPVISSSLPASVTSPWYTPPKFISGDLHENSSLSPPHRAATSPRHHRDRGRSRSGHR